MLYPGSVGLLQKAMRPMLQQGQAKLIEEVQQQTFLLNFTFEMLNTCRAQSFSLFSTLSQFDGQRNKLVACDSNEIDTMFVDRRRDGSQNGKTLVNDCSDLLFLCPGIVPGPSKTSVILQMVLELCHRSSAVRGMQDFMKWAA